MAKSTTKTQTFTDYPKPRPNLDANPLADIIENQLARRSKRVEQIFSVVGALIAFSGLVIGFVYNPTKDDNFRSREMQLMLRNQREALDSLQRRLDNIQQHPHGNDTLTFTLSSNAQLTVFQRSLDSLKKRFAKIESIIIKDPSQVLEIPLIKREIEDNKTANQAKFETLNKDIERAYNIILVSLAGLAVSVFAPVLSSIIQRKRTNESENKTPDEGVNLSKSTKPKLSNNSQ
ncbi:hypothetical protein GCM10028805_22470 [Spirosoma harenae]